MCNPDFHLSFHGSLCLIEPLSTEARNWWDDNVDPDALSLGGAYAVEPRYVEPIMEGILREGMTIQ